MKYTVLTVLALMSFPQGVQGCRRSGIAGDADQVSRTIDVSMMDSMKFVPATLKIKQGETIRFIAKNDGQVLHEFVLGTTETNDQHAKLMIKFPGMEHD